MSIFLTAIIVVTAFLALYWVFYGQRKHNEMMNPKRKTELKAVLFDLDGVIVDSLDLWFGIFNRVRKDFKLKQISKQEFTKNVWGGSVDADVKRYYNNMDPGKLEKIYKSHIMSYANKSKLMPDAKRVLKKIKDKKIKIGLATNNFKNAVNAILKFHKIDNYFDAVVTGNDIEKAKPFPDSILKLCEKLKIMPDEAIYVGDTKNDYKAGKSAGCFVVGLNTQGDLIISELKDIQELI
ncbi:hypothetical protein CL615_00615 [archaeon]|jgi:HAD superfamily hydrolase (TIGR01549 family)|nr:hypothetical protein [archaeon]MDP6547697.1 HAD family hydrolase [Candidatus Woesearchaeota archaeon]|tara:strand:- start:3704 stop:4414 length:711 start_codon:yes stop_codon:yes gene_type:complete